MTTTNALISAGAVLIAALISGVGGVTLGAWLTGRSQTKNMEAARAHQLEDQAAADLRSARDETADAYVQAREGVAWLHSVRVEDCVLEPWKTNWAEDLEANLSRIVTARRTLDRSSTILGDLPLGSVARDTGHQLLLLQNAWADALYHAEGMHGTSSKAYHERKWGEAVDKIDASRRLLIGYGGESLLSDELRLGGQTENSLLSQLRSEIGNVAASQASRNNVA